jgi:hypothetical protein
MDFQSSIVNCLQDNGGKMKKASCLLAALAAFGLTSCGGSDSTTADGASCYPEAARRWISEPSSKGPAAGDLEGPSSIYLDGSASMAGFIRGANADERPLADLVGFLPTFGPVAKGKVSILRFDRRITELKPSEAARMQTAEGYLCPPGKPDCDAQESHVDQALAKIAGEDARSLSVVVSDLWLANSEVLTTGGVALSKPLADILASGRSIAIYGFESPYAGRVSDLPSGAKNVVASRRHLFLVVAGPLRRLEAFHEAMRRAPSASIARALTNGQAHRSLFTLDPVIAAAGTQRFQAEPKSLLTKANFLTVRSGVRVPQFHLEKGKALRAGSTDIPGAVWQGVAEADIAQGAVWQGASRGSTKLYRQTGDGCSPGGGDWRAEGTLRGGWSDDAKASFKLDPTELATLPAGRYLLVGDVRRTSLESPNSATQWMRDWSFGAADEAAAIKRPVMPTLNLAETARLLEAALAQSAEAKPMNIGGFTVAVDIE